MKKQKGFSLIELLIVVAIILIIAAIAIPNLLRSRIAANEASAAAGVRTLVTTEITYSTTYISIGFTTLTSLGNGGGSTTCSTPSETHACLIDNALSNAATLPKSGYKYDSQVTTTGTPAVGVTFTASAWPAAYNGTGVRTFCADQTGVVQYDQASHTAAIADKSCISPFAPI